METELSARLRAGMADLFRTPGRAGLGPEVRAGVLSAEEVEAGVKALALPQSEEPVLRAISLFWHDHLELAHSVAQDLPTPEGSYLHGMMHRREPDFANARYWFHRAGRLLFFSKLEKNLHADAAMAALFPGPWNPDRLVDLCAQVSRSPDKIPLLEQVQQEEVWSFACASIHPK